MCIRDRLEKERFELDSELMRVKNEYDVKLKNAEEANLKLMERITALGGDAAEAQAAQSIAGARVSTMACESSGGGDDDAPPLVRLAERGDVAGVRAALQGGAARGARGGDGRAAVRTPEEDGWEQSDFPVVCSDCLGPNPYVRMQKENYGAECAISGRPFTVFRWRPGHDARYKKTVVCKEIALAKNVCQVCLLDLEYGIPVQARDAALGAISDMAVPKSAVNVEYVTKQIEEKLAEDGTADVTGMLGGVAGNADDGVGGKSAMVKDALEQLTMIARKKQY